MKAEDKKRIAQLKLEHAQFEAAIDTLEKQVDALSASARERELEAYKIRFGLTVGCSVVDRKGWRFRVVAVCDNSWADPFEREDKPWLHVARIKKDGSVSARQQLLIDGYTVEAKP